MQGLVALCHTARKGGHIGSRSTYTGRASSPLDRKPSQASRPVLRPPRTLCAVHNDAQRESVFSAVHQRSWPPVPNYGRLLCAPPNPGSDSSPVRLFPISR